MPCSVAAAAAAEHGIERHVVKLAEAKHGLVLVPRCWVRDCERLSETVVGLHFVAFSCLMLQQAFALLAEP